MVKNVNMMVVLVMVMAIIAMEVGNAQDLASLVSQGQSGGLSLQQVVGVLKQRGMLDQVNPELLRRIEDQLGTNLVTKQEEEDERKRKEKSFLEKAQRGSFDRRRTLFGTRPPTRPTRPSSKRNQLFQSSGECQALKTENKLLKQQLLKQSEKEQNPTTAIDVLRQFQNQGLFKKPKNGFVENQDNPLEKLLAESSIQDTVIRGAQGGDNRSVRSILITPTPTMSTVLETLSFTTTVTKNITQEINIFLHGRKIPTHIIETKVEVETSSSVVSSTIKVTPTPTWQTITVTPTVTPPTPPSINFNQLLQDKETEKLELLKTIQRLQRQKVAPSFGGVQAKVVEIGDQLDNFPSLQQYLEQIRKQKIQSSQTILAQPLIQEPPSISPSTTVSTIYMSGSIPGEYSTSLVTITNSQERYRRSAGQEELLFSAPITISTQQVELEGSFNTADPSFCEGQRTVTITVTAAPTECLP